MARYTMSRQTWSDLALIAFFLGIAGTAACGRGERTTEESVVAASARDAGRWDSTLSARWARVDPERAAQKGCRSCHDGIETISERMQPVLLSYAGNKAGYECAVCHEGQPSATTKRQAHTGLIPNPSNMWAMAEGRGCAKCHSERGALTTVMGRPLEKATGGALIPWHSVRTDPSGATGGNHVYRMQRALMALETGKANKVLSSNGVIPKGMFPYANFDMDDPDGPVPSAGSDAYKQWIAKAIESGHIVRLERTHEIPTYERGKAVFGDPSKAAFADMHRKQCARCHVWGEGRNKRGDLRAGGCAACHVIYTNDGRYEGSDRTIPKDRGPHPLRHQITIAIPAEQCTHCHTRGKRIGTTYVGMFEYDYVKDERAPPWREDLSGQLELYTKQYVGVRPDLHAERGILCADCHSSIDVHGDGNIYPVTFHQVEISCSDCHGTPDQYPWELTVGYGTPVVLAGARGTYQAGRKEYLLTNRGNAMARWVREGNRAFLVSASDTTSRREIPLLHNVQKRDGWKTHQGKVAMSTISQHVQKLECYACHSTWAPQCYGCHLQYDIRKQGTDWALSALRHDPITGRQRETKTPGDIKFENRGFMRWESPILGVNFRGKVSPLVPGCQVVWTFTDENGKTWQRNAINRTSDGFPAPTLAPLNPHANTLVARTCEDCHANPKAVGYGTAKSRSAGVLEGDAPVFANQAAGVRGDIPGAATAVDQVPRMPDFPYTWDQLVTRSGKQVQNMPLPQDRPLNAQERSRTEREGLCVACHQHYGTPEWDRVRRALRAAISPEGRAYTPDQHDRAVELALKALAGSGDGAAERRPR
ncbi:MAG: hypothetical protein HY561_01980 [Gemmatimonadetes bacterium]|nr:hypothetical protein [Gemmatimonadota bacterium]